MNNPNSLQDPLVYFPAVTPSSPASAFAGLPPATLQAFLAQAQTALNSLICGNTVATISYGEAQGQKSVTYTRADVGKLRLHVYELKQLLGMVPRRRAARVVI